MGDSSVLEQLSAQLFEDALNPPHEAKGVDQTFLDSLDRIPRKKLKKDDTCAICNTAYLEGENDCLIPASLHICLPDGRSIPSGC